MDSDSDSLASIGIRKDELTNIQMDFDDFLEAQVLDFENGFGNLYREPLADFVNYVYETYVERSVKQSVEEGLNLVLQDLVSEPNDPMTRDTIANRIFQHIVDTLVVEDASSIDTIDQNASDFKVEVLGKKISVHVGPDSLSGLPTVKTTVV